MHTVNLEDLRSVRVPVHTTQPTFDLNRLCELLQLPEHWIQSLKSASEPPEYYKIHADPSKTLLSSEGIIYVLQFIPSDISNLQEVTKTLKNLGREYWEPIRDDSISDWNAVMDQLHLLQAENQEIRTRLNNIEARLQ